MVGRITMPRAWNALVLALLALVGSPVVGATPRPGEGFHLSVRAASPRRTILQCEPLVVDIAVRNDGSEAVEFYEMQEGATAPLSYRVTGPDGLSYDYLPLRVAERQRGPKVGLAPGEVYKYRKDLLYGVLRSGSGVKKAGYAFSDVGDHLITLVFHVVDAGAVRRFESAPFRVTCSEPTGPDQEALQLFRGPEQGEFVADLNKKVIPGQFRRLAKEYPDTVYGRYARFYLARTLLEHRFDWPQAKQDLAAELAGLDSATAARRLSERVYGRTAEEFAELARSDPAFPLADECLLNQARCYSASPANRKAEAVKVLEDLVAKYPESPVAVTARKRLEELTRPREPAPPAPAETKPEEAVPGKEGPGSQSP